VTSHAPARSDVASPPKWRTWLRLGRVSNLPTVWTNALAGVILARPDFDIRPGVMLAAAFSCFYVGGMFLNDAFDRDIDAAERPERPIPRGLVSAQDVFVAGFFMLGLGTALVGATAYALGDAALVRAIGASLVLSGTIVLYNAWHKGNPFSTVLMGACRVLVYLTAALAAAGRIDQPVVMASALLLAYVMGLTYVAKQENLVEFHNTWPLVPLLVPFGVTAVAAFKSPVAAILWLSFLAWVAYTISRLWKKGRGVIPLVVVRLIAAISLLDALVVATHGAPLSALLLALAFPATLFLQRWVKGT
jgi:4-hydroxybenzoate polyprenyltransferase